MPSKAVIVWACAAVLALSGCGSPSADVYSSPTSAPRTAAADHDHDEAYALPSVVWDADSEAAAKAAATKAMQHFRRTTTVTDKEWFDAFRPNLTRAYADSARYIDPSRIPVTTVASGPTLTRESGNPLSVTAEFATDNGAWLVALHRTGQSSPWLVADIAPKRG
jgi:ABC-type transporter MlaC component